MSKTTIRLIIVLMSAALLGLVGFQIYWVSNAQRINKARFKQDVHEALSLVAQKLEKQETFLIAQNNFKSKFRWSDPLDLSSDTIEFFESSFQKRVVNRNDLDNDSLSIPNQTVLSYQFEANDGFEIIAEIDEQANISEKTNIKDGNNEVKVLRKEYNNDSEIGKNIKHDFQKIARKAEMFNVVLNEILSGKRQIKNRINPQRLDSLLKTEFNNKGITLVYDFGVLNENSEEFVFSRIEDDHYKLRESDLRTALFPNDVVGASSHVLVSFPNQQKFLLRKMGLTLASSILLILIIIFCFAYAITTIIKQKKLSEVKNDFINNMTHEFKTPISTVSLACEALQDKDISENQSIRERYLNIIKVENKRLAVQVEKVLQMATLDKGEFDLKISDVNVNQIIEEAVSNIYMQVEKKGGSVEKILKAQQSMIEADELHVSNIIRNLLDNANKYSPVEPKITVKTEDKPNGISIKIIDKGIGLAKESIHKIFDKFYRVPTGNVHDFKGFGLGLAYVKTMVEAHGGSINVKSELNKGSIFELFFPKKNAKTENTFGRR
ncbi:HAMP domain-containing sensor histidine kinase [Fulvivirgaceae bacterium BMA12]|uniref:histidine kinase n=1 Tax=Agaribacillus aureus TaxID=3051825 RepID=A0ABT8LF08_9BACT|nr:HAMP domain-containing sensor histidine kinase [Fulvivirgaceae bacterium BMA12]